MTESKIVNEVAYHKDTPDDLIKLLDALRISKKRVILYCGDSQTGQVSDSESGTIGRSSGSPKIPILVKTSRSLGGSAISTNHIIEVCASVKPHTRLWKLDHCK